MSGCRPTCHGSVKAVDRSLKPTREIGRSGGPLAAPGAVWVCVRAWNANTFQGILGSTWIGSESEQIVSPLPPTTEAGSTTSTTAAGPTSTTAAPGPQYPALDFDTFYPANTYNPATTGAAMTCGPPTTTASVGLPGSNWPRHVRVLRDLPQPPQAPQRSGNAHPHRV